MLLKPKCFASDSNCNDNDQEEAIMDPALDSSEEFFASNYGDEESNDSDSKSKQSCHESHSIISGIEHVHTLSIAGDCFH